MHRKKGVKITLQQIKKVINSIIGKIEIFEYGLWISCQYYTNVNSPNLDDFIEII